MRVMKAVGLLIALVGLCGCALLAPGQKPEVHLVNVQPGSHEGFEQHFIITLLVLNPTSSELKVSGMSYNLKLQGEKLISGVSGGINPIPPYGQSTIKVPASANLISGLKIIGAFMESRSQSVDFELEARLNMGWFHVPVSVVEAGSIDLGKYQ